MSRTFNESKIVMPSEAENLRLVAAAEGAQHTSPSTDEQLMTMVPMDEVLRRYVARQRKGGSTATS